MINYGSIFSSELIPIFEAGKERIIYLELTFMNEKFSGINKNLEYIRHCVNLFFSMPWLNLFDEGFGWSISTTIYRGYYKIYILVNHKERFRRDFCRTWRQPSRPQSPLSLPCIQCLLSPWPAVGNQRAWKYPNWSLVTNTCLNRDAGILLPLISINLTPKSYL